MEKLDFDKFLADLRAGDERAAAELVRRYEPYLRHVIRVRLTDPRLRRVFDSLDVCQSALGEFFRRMADGRFQFQDPDRLRALLVTMALNKLFDRARHERRHGGGLPDNFDAPTPTLSPDEQALHRELAQAIRDRLSNRESWLIDQRLQGRSWIEIAALDGGQADTLRMMYSRAVARVRRQFSGECSHVP
jgi:RNA polymerase sigma factor (sigma-70 family)